MENSVSFIQSFQSGDMLVAKEKLRKLHLSSLISRHPDYVGELAAKLRDKGLITQMKRTDRKGDTALHLAVREEHLDLVRILVKLEESLCDCANTEGQTPLKLAVSLGFDEGVELLLTSSSNALHYIVELNQVELVKHLMEKKVDLSKLINEPCRLLTHQCEEENEGEQYPNEKISINVSCGGGDKCLENATPIVREGDTPLHIAARNNYEDMVNLLLTVPGVKKLALNSEEKTSFDIAREVTEYHESFRTIRRLGVSRSGPKRFMYCAPQVSHQKYTKMLSKLNKAYEERRNSELIVAALLAAMTCAALFAVPGGFHDSNSPSHRVLVLLYLYVVFHLSFSLFSTA